MSDQVEYTVFWFKRDLRLSDNTALRQALMNAKPVVLIYILEPALESDPHYSNRHFNFVRESLVDLNKQLEPLKTKVLCVRGDALEIISTLNSVIPFAEMYSTAETGLNITFQRDKAIKAFCNQEDILWSEYPQNGVARGVRNRLHWREAVLRFLHNPVDTIDLQEGLYMNIDKIDNIASKFEVFDLLTPQHPFQVGGRTEGLKWAESFFDDRIKNYSAHISKPESSQVGCSRLSPYFAWGNLSVREVYQRAIQMQSWGKHAIQVKTFTSRLKWQSHFIQKFEAEMRMEKEALNRGFSTLSQPRNERYVDLWKAGKTGYPLVDASIRSVVNTGYLNFRMRALITSFLTHHLFQHFTVGAPWLAQQFLDFEPGIHYGQMQMQAGFTGINTVRVYNPTRNALIHDPDAIFIKKHIPELRDLPPYLAIEPWKMTAMEGAMYGFEYGIDYPERIVDIAVTRRNALEKLYGQRKSSTSKVEILRILDTHTLHRSESRFP